MLLTTQTTHGGLKEEEKEEKERGGSFSFPMMKLVNFVAVHMNLPRVPPRPLVGACCVQEVAGVLKGRLVPLLLERELGTKKENKKKKKQKVMDYNKSQ